MGYEKESSFLVCTLYNESQICHCCRTCPYLAREGYLVKLTNLVVPHPFNNEACWL